MGRLRIDDFYNKIGVCIIDEELISICNLEKEYITNSYNTLESRKASFTIYRNGFANHYLKNNYVNIMVPPNYMPSGWPGSRQKVSGIVVN